MSSTQLAIALFDFTRTGENIAERLQPALRRKEEAYRDMFTTGRKNQTATHNNTFTKDLVVLHESYAAVVDVVHCKATLAALELEPGLIRKVIRTTISHVVIIHTAEKGHSCSKGRVM